MESTWTEVDEYFAERLAPDDAALHSALADSDREGLPAISVTPTKGKFLQLLVRIRKAQRILEIGTLGGYSTIWMGRALAPGGTIVTLEIDPKHAEVAHRNIERAGLRGRVEIRVAPAAESLAQMKQEHVDPFDLVFIDADKASTAAYYDASVELSRAGSLIVIDNVARQGKVIEADSDDASVQGIRSAVDRIAGDPRVSATAIQTVSSKGYDGFLLAVVL
ncbi:MAG TPA: O-methyltransferase [Gemmatimonadaceae bacterium]|nr:O-methyltransferase [Gemmatimonadaceae bacterium]